MPTLGTATTASATRRLLLGSGEMGMKLALEAQRFGVGLALGETLEEARQKAKAVADAVEVTL